PFEEPENKEANRLYRPGPVARPACIPPPAPASAAHEPAEAAALRATLLKVELAREPSVLMAVRQTTTISASMTAYSTAVGPSSASRNRSALLSHSAMNLPPFCEPGPGHRDGPGAASSLPRVRR